jgi:putative ABC transport system permease protein
MNPLPQIATTTLLNLRNMPRRIAASLVAAIGIGGVVAVMIGVLSMSEGFRAVLQYSGRDDVAVVLRGGSDDEMSSGLAQQQTRVIGDAPGIRRDDQGAMLSPELYVIVELALKTTGTNANVPLRGATARAPQLRKGFHMLAGRMFQPGMHELIVGKGAARQFAGLDIGSTLRWGSLQWTVVGQFADNGSVSEGELWTDATVLQGAYKRGTSFQSVRVQLQSAAARQAFESSLKSDPRLNVRVQSEREYYQAQSRIFTLLVDNIGRYIAFLMGLGAIFGAVNTMYSTVSARTREIATLRALGFGASAIVVSVLVEALVLGLAGGLVGSVAAYLAFNGMQASTLNLNSFSQVTFAFAVTPRLMLLGLSYALLLALIGALMPALRAARLPIVSGLRAL